MDPTACASCVLELPVAPNGESFSSPARRFCPAHGGSASTVLDRGLHGLNTGVFFPIRRRRNEKPRNEQAPFGLEEEPAKPGLDVHVPPVLSCFALAKYREVNVS